MITLSFLIRYFGEYLLFLNSRNTFALKIIIKINLRNDEVLLIIILDFRIIRMQNSRSILEPSLRIGIRIHKFNSIIKVFDINNFTLYIIELTLNVLIYIIRLKILTVLNLADKLLIIYPYSIINQILNVIIIIFELFSLLCKVLN